MASIGDVVWVPASRSRSRSRIQLVFWFTVVFAIVERTEGKDIGAATQWTPDHLPALPVPGRMQPRRGRADRRGPRVRGGCSSSGSRSPPRSWIDGQAYPVLDPALWSFWLPWLLVVIGLEVVFNGALYLRGRWTWPFAVVNALLAAASAIPAIWLIQTDRFWNPAAVDALEGSGCGRRHTERSARSSRSQSR